MKKQIALLLASLSQIKGFIQTPNCKNNNYMKMHIFLQKLPAGKLFISFFGKVIGKFNHIFSKSKLSTKNLSLPLLTIPRFLKMCEADGCAINFDDFEKKANQYENLNELFTRRFKPGVRFFSQNQNIFSAPAEGMLTSIPSLKKTDSFFVKNKKFSLASFLKSPKNEKLIGEDPMVLIFRLRIGDYHRFHMPTSAQIIEVYDLGGKLLSVQPSAFTEKQNPFIENYRKVLVCKTTQNNIFLIVIVGAFNVGSIKISCKLNQLLSAGDEIGFFEIGGSTVVTIIPQENNFSNLKKINNYTESFSKLGQII